MCVQERERERERESGWACVHLPQPVRVVAVPRRAGDEKVLLNCLQPRVPIHKRERECVCVSESERERVCVCERERERERERGGERERV